MSKVLFFSPRFFSKAFIKVMCEIGQKLAELKAKIKYKIESFVECLPNTSNIELTKNKDNPALKKRIGIISAIDFLLITNDSPIKIRTIGVKVFLILFVREINKFGKVS